MTPGRICRRSSFVSTLPAGPVTFCSATSTVWVLMLGKSLINVTLRVPGSSTDGVLGEKGVNYLRRSLDPWGNTSNTPQTKQWLICRSGILCGARLDRLFGLLSSALGLGTPFPSGQRLDVQLFWKRPASTRAAGTSRRVLGAPARRRFFYRVFVWGDSVPR